ncbi:four helix bundle protein [Candidatus Uhrbacteria bacterium]|nr:MAG: four helix bundle protein [Candidatus Uhrbacteria bacterium]
MNTGNHKNLIVWQKAMDLVVLIYGLTDSFPKEEIYGLTSQIRRAAVSIPSNISEGRRRMTKTEFKHFCRIAFGSASELETQLEISGRLKFGSDKKRADCQVLLDEVMRMLNKLASARLLTTPYFLLTSVCA